MVAGRREDSAEAAKLLSEAARLDPDEETFQYSLGGAYLALEEFDRAEACFRRALQIKPDYYQAAEGLILLLLSFGRVEEARDMCLPGTEVAWDGADLGGKTVALLDQQGHHGLGDANLFARLAPALKGRGAGRIAFHVRPELGRLFRTLPAVDQVTVVGRDPMPAHDIPIDICYAGRFFTDDLRTPTGQVPYLHAAPTLVETWRPRVAPSRDALNVGLVWASGHSPRPRSVPLRALAPLARVDGVTLYGLQVGPQAKQAERAGITDIRA